MIQLGDHFRSNERSRHSEWLRRRQWFIKARRDQVRQDQIIDRQEDEVLSLAAEATMATEIQIEEFEARLDVYEARLDAFGSKLDAYDVAITNALIENQEILDGLLAYREELLAKAYVLEDGRRVFKSEDGKTVIDEFENVVGEEIIDPGMIPDNLTKSDVYVGVNSEVRQVRVDKKQLHTAQEKVYQAREKIPGVSKKIQEAREKIAEGNLTVDELEDLDDDILGAMPSLSSLPKLPPTAMKFLSGVENVASIPNAKGAFGSVNLTNASPSANAVAPAEPSLVN